MYLGIDVGGTNIDGVILEAGKLLKTEKLPIGNDLLEAINTCLENLLTDIKPNKITRINLSTTISTNAIVEKQTPPVGLILQTGPGIAHDFSAISEQIEYISGYVDHRGKLIMELNQDEVIASLKSLKTNKFENLAVVTKFSTRNLMAEEKIYNLAKADFSNISLGHEISGKLNFPRRVNSAVLNSAVMQIFSDFAKQIVKGLGTKNIDAPINILKADGGTMTLEQGVDKPVETILSGPAASFMGIMALLENEEDAILMDIGGTTTDIFFVVDKNPLFEPLGAEIDGHKTLVRALYVHSVGLGGDSAIILENDQLKIGPRRLGKPMAMGGDYPTPTDAMIHLGKLDVGNKEQAQVAMNQLATELNCSSKEIAEQILENFADRLKVEVDQSLEIINNKPLYTVREVLEDKKLEPQEIRLIGGPAAILSKYVEQSFELKTIYPQDFSVANAIGAALAIPSFETNLIADTGRDILSVPELSIYEQISRRYDLTDAKKLVIEELEKSGYEAEIVEEESFNMVDGFRENQNIRIKAQIKPGLEYSLVKEQS